MVFSMLVANVILLSSWIDVSTSQGSCRQLHFTTALSFEGSRLINHVIRTIESVEMEFCGALCFLENNCVSFNEELTSESTAGTKCELNNSTHQEHPDDLKPWKNYTYRGAKNPCGKNPCHNNATCQVGFTDKGYRCICVPGFKGRNCDEGCPEGWVADETSCYFLPSKVTKKMSDARNECHKMSAHLLIIKSAEENSFILKLLQARGKKWTWLGLQRKQNDSEFYWIDGTPLVGNYHSWAPKEPTNSDGEPCAFVSVDSSAKGAGSWHDVPCEIGVDIPFVCQRAL